MTYPANNDELPDGWIWGIGEAGSSYYDHWAYHDEWELHMYWDEGQPHCVELLEYDANAPEDERTAAYPTKTLRCETKEEAEETAIQLMEEYQ